MRVERDWKSEVEGVESVKIDWVWAVKDVSSLISAFLSFFLPAVSDITHKNAADKCETADNWNEIVSY